jgi:hypothetical protein
MAKPWEKDWTQQSASKPWEKDWAGAQLDADGIPLPSRGTVRRSDIVPVDQTTRSVKGIGTIAFPQFVQDMFPSDEQDALDQWRKKTAYELAPGKGSVEATRTTPQDVENLAQKRWEQAGRKAPKKDVSQVAAGLIGAADIATLGFSDEFAALKPAEQALMSGKGFNAAGKAFGEARQDYKALQADAVQQRPVSTRVGQTVALSAPGGKIYSGAARLAPKLVAPTVAARLAGQSLAAQGVRYTGRLGALGGIGAGEFYAYNALAEAPNQAREAGAALPSVGERVDYANSQILSPGGLISAGIPIAGSAIARGIRAPLAATKNVLTTGTVRPAVTAGRPTIAPAAGQPAKAPLTNLLTPASVQKQVAGFAGNLRTMSRTDAEAAIDMLLKRNFDPDEAEKMVLFLDYAGKSEVPEMLFQLFPKLRSVDQLTVALGTVGGEAQEMLGTALGKQAQETPGVIRDALRKAMGIAGEDFYKLGKDLKAGQIEAPKQGYKDAYAKEVSDDTWTNQIVPQLRTKYGREAVADAVDYAEGIAGNDPAQLAVAGQLAELRDALGSQGATPGKVSTQSLDYIDRMLGDLAKGLKSGSGRSEIAKGPTGVQRAIRGDANSGLDVETGLADPRRLSYEYKSAQEAMVFGRKAYKDGTDIETLLDEFDTEMSTAGKGGSESEIVRGALLMSWLRGAEDDISRATNPQSVIRRIYGSERQREKLLAMMPELADDAGAGAKGSNTKDIRALIGGTRDDGREMAGMIDRLKRISNDYNRIIGNSQSAQRLEAVAEQGGTQDRINQLFDMIEAPKAFAVKAARTAANSLIRPGIYIPGVNRELGRLLTARGKKQLLATIAEIRARQLATGKGPKPAAPPPASGGTASTAQKPGKLGTRTADAVAIAALASGGPTAEADTGGASAELKTANERVNTATKRIETADNELARLREEVLLLERVAAEEPPVPLVPTAEGKRVQRILAARNFDLGPNGVDGRVGGDTRKALAGNIAAIKSDIAKTEAERESALKEAGDARNAEKQARFLQMQRDSEPSDTQGLLVGGAALGAAIAGAMLAKGGRFRNVNFGRYGSMIQSNAKAATTTRKVNKLINTGKLSTAQSGANSTNQRAANVNTIAQIGGAGRRVPFEENAAGVLTERTRKNAFGQTVRPKEVSELFKPQRFNSNDAYAFGVAGLDVGITEGGIRHLKSEIKAAEAEMEAAKKADDEPGFYAALKKKQSNEGLLVFAQIAQKVGMGYIGGRALTGIKPYSAPTPDLAGIRAERTLIMQAINKPPPKPRKPASAKAKP